MPWTHTHTHTHTHTEGHSNSLAKCSTNYNSDHFYESDILAITRLHSIPLFTYAEHLLLFLDFEKELDWVDIALLSIYIMMGKRLYYITRASERKHS